MSRITAYGSPALGATRKSGATEKSVEAAAVAAPTDNTVRNAPTTTTSFAQVAASSAPIDEGRVAAIRDALANGSYVIDAEKLAAKMIELDLGVVAN
ncbi:flagellar biosynthesis anti-sigma factor FlgM [Blastomonas fulva]|jgi:negative regulator of flagellin synthesis FlgM|uniref:flagellar biosynthesis anti-sigma factor FlgM n=1 Tax=Blastomonas fulva TaxID=1550728 RepID=UPI003F72F58E